MRADVNHCPARLACAEQFIYKTAFIELQAGRFRGFEFAGGAWRGGVRKGVAKRGFHFIKVEILECVVSRRSAERMAPWRVVHETGDGVFQRLNIGCCDHLRRVAALEEGQRFEFFRAVGKDRRAGRHRFGNLVRKRISEIGSRRLVKIICDKKYVGFGKPAPVGHVIEIGKGEGDPFKFVQLFCLTRHPVLLGAPFETDWKPAFCEIGDRTSNGYDAVFCRVRSKGSRIAYGDRIAAGPREPRPILRTDAIMGDKEVRPVACAKNRGHAFGNGEVHIGFCKKRTQVVVEFAELLRV